jgi:ligand-binding sensor domain-containing protein
MKKINIIYLLIFLASQLQAQDWSIYGTGVNGVAYDLDGSMWVAANGGIYHHLAGGWLCYNAGNSPLPLNKVNCVAVDASGNKWFGLEGHGAIRFDGINWTQYDFIFSASTGNSVNKIVPMGNTIWASGYYLVGKFNGSGWDFKLLDSRYTTNSIIPDSIGNLWIRTTGGLCKYDGTNITFYNDSIQTSDALGKDHHGNFWLYSDSGLVKFDGANFYHLGSNYNYQYVKSIFVDLNDNIWLGAAYGKLYKYSSGTWSVYDTSNSQLSENGTTKPFLKDVNGNLLVGNSLGGLLSFDGINWSDISQPAWSNSKGLATVITSAENNLGETYVIYNNNISKIVGNTITNISLLNLGVNTGIVRKIYFDQNNIMWLATSGGIIKYDGSTLTRFTLPGTFTYSVYDIVQDTLNNNLLFSADVGLLRYDGTNLVNLTTLYSSNAYSLREMCYDNQHQLWIGSSNRGLIKFVDSTFTYFNTHYQDVEDIAIDQNNIKCIVSGPMYFEFNDSTGQIIDSIYITPYSFHNVAIDNLNNKWLTSSDGIYKKITGQQGAVHYTYTNSGYPGNEGYDLRIGQNNVKVISAGINGLVYLDDINVGISKRVEASKITLYPNPASDYLNINFGKNKVGEYRIYNYAGVLKDKRKINSSFEENLQIDISVLQTGTYILELLGNESISSSRFVIIK